MFSNCNNNSNNSKKCSKGGVKIHETCSNNSNNNSNNNSIFSYDPNEFYNNLKRENKHTGIRISQGNNEYNIDPFDNINPFANPDGEKDFKNVVYDNSSYDKMDININNYSIEAIYKLFGVQNKVLTDEVMREAKKIALKAHPDKSRLDPKYFLFFSEAYKRLHNIYEFQNKTVKKNEDISGHYKYTNENKVVLDNLFEKEKDLKTPGNFNKWFNEQFDKHKLEDDTTQSGYGDWLKSNDDIIEGVTKDNIDKRKKEVQSIVQYNGVNKNYSSGFGASSLMEYNSNFTSSSLFNGDGMGYSDLRQAYVESVIPITEDDYNKMPKFKNVEEYSRYRGSQEVQPLDRQESMRQLYNENTERESQSAALAFYYAKQSELANKKSEDFWSGLKQIHL